MIVIKLYKTDFDLLKSVVDQDVFGRLSYESEKYDYIAIQANEQMVDIIQDQLISKLMEVGFNAEFKINPYGNELESLIDKISAS